MDHDEHLWRSTLIDRVGRPHTRCFGGEQKNYPKVASVTLAASRGLQKRCQRLAPVTSDRSDLTTAQRHTGDSVDAGPRQNPF
jgi:hypothetical protein